MKKNQLNCADLLVRLSEILPATMASIHALYTAMLSETNIQVSLCLSSLVCASNTMTDPATLCCSLPKSMPPQVILHTADGKPPEKIFMEPARGEQLPQGRAATLREISVLVYSKWRMSFTWATQFIWSSSSQDWIL